MDKKENIFGKNVASLLSYRKKELLSAKTALDIGCAYGANAYYLASLGINVDAIDKNLPDTLSHPLLKFQEIDILNFPFNKEYDIILAFNVLQFLSKEDKYTVLNKMVSALNPNGFIFIRSFTQNDPSFGKIGIIKSHFAKNELLNWAKENHLNIKSYREKTINDNHEPLGKHTHGFTSLVAQAR